MHSHKIEGVDDIARRITRRLDDREHEVVATFQDVTTGELKMVETISPEEVERARMLFGRIVEVGPRRVWAELQPIVFDPALSKDILDPGFDYTPSVRDILGTILKLDGRTQARLAVLLVSYVFYEEFHYPQPETGVYDIAKNPFQKLKWLYRYWFNQLEVAEKNSNLEEFFARQRLDVPEISKIPPLFGGTWRSFSVSCAGDLLAVNVLTPENTRHLFDDIIGFYSSADIVSANLESTVDASRPIGRTQVRGQPAKMNTSEAMFYKFRNEAKINYFSTATNHAMDWGEEGVRATIAVLKKSGAYYSGTAASRAEQDDVVVVEKNGIKVGFLSFTFDLNGYELPRDKSYLVNEVRFNDVDPPPDYSLIKKQVALARAKGAEHIIAYCHWGWEFEMYPHVNIVEAARDVIECGVDTILGNHPHVSQPAELVDRPGQKPALVIYAFGDFVSYHPESRNSKLAYIVKFDIVKYGFAGEVFVANLRALPIYIVNEKLEGGRFDCRIVEFQKVLDNPDGYGLTDLEKRQLPHLRDKVWEDILSPLAKLPK
ncbi:CapA family protein [Burkholderia pyrrocinia]